MMTNDGYFKQTDIDEYFATKKQNPIYGWIHLIVCALLPFSTVENNVFREHIQHAPISRDTFMRYLSRLTKSVESKLSALLPSRIALIFDGWTAGSSHYLSVFASYTSTNSRGFEVRLLSLSPMGDECSLNADEHIDYLTFVLELYNKSWENVSVIVGDNVSVNRSISTKTGIPMIGCASHRFNLAVRDYLSSEEHILTKINEIMVKLKSLLIGARLRQFTPLRPKLRNVTRWSSTFEMLSRYRELRDFLPALDSTEIDEMSLTVSENRQVDCLFEKLKLFESVTKALQTDKTSMSDVRTIFDAVIGEHPSTHSRLSATAPIVHCPEFESGVVEVQRGSPNALTVEEQLCMKEFERECTTGYSADDHELSFVERALKRQKVAFNDSESKYVDLRYLFPTSNICERLFSKVGCALTERRKGITPEHLESQIFLNINRDLWDASTINDISNRVHS